MNLESINKIIEAQFNNFHSSRKQFEDIVTWVERLKGIISIHNIHDLVDPIEYSELLHIAGNAFVISIILAMEKHYLFALGASRVGIEAIINMAIIESNHEKHLNVWKRYNEYNQDSEEWKSIYNDYNKVFLKDKKKHDYSRFIDDDDKKYIIDRWEFLSNYGSHPSMMHSVFSTRFSNNESGLSMTYGLFDDDPKNVFGGGKIVLFLIDIYFVLSKIYSKIFKIHNIDLIYSYDRINKLYFEWIEFRDNKLNEFKYNENRNV